MQQNKEIVKLYTLLTVSGDTFSPSQREQEVVEKTVELFRRTAQNRDRNFAYFDGMNITEYIEDSVERFNTNLYMREGMEDWQAGFNDKFTQNKVLSFVGKLIEQLPIASAIPRGEEDTLRAQIITDIYQFTEEKDNYETQMSMFVLELLVKGTAIGYEDIQYKKKKHRVVKGIGDNMTVTEKVYKSVDFYSELVPVNEYYPASVGVMGTEAQPYSFWVKEIDLATFKEKFGHYKKAVFVEGKQSIRKDTVSVPYYNDFISDSISDGNVELIRFYDSVNDEYIMLANGIWLNPLGTNEEVQPLPWNHKEQPFYSAINEPFGVFFYGRSLPSKLAAMQDILNVIQNMVVDQSFLSIYTPIITAGFEDFEDDFIRPGRRTSIDTGGLPLNQAFMPLQFPTPTGWHQYILEYTRRIMEEASLDKISGGVAGQGAERTTAFEVNMAAAGVAAILTMVARFLNRAIKRKAMLRIKNILQFGFDPKSPLVPGIMGDMDTTKPFATISVGDTKLTSGDRGSRIIELYSSSDTLPSPDMMSARSLLASAEQKKKIEVTAISPEYINNVELDIILGLDTKRERSSIAEQGLLLQQIQVLSNVGGDRVNLDEPITKLAISMGMDPTKIINQEQAQPQQPEAAGVPGAGGQAMGEANRQIAQMM